MLLFSNCRSPALLKYKWIRPLHRDMATELPEDKIFICIRPSSGCVILRKNLGGCVKISITLGAQLKNLHHLGCADLLGLDEGLICIHHFREEDIIRANSPS